MKSHNTKAESKMDLYGNKVNFGAATLARNPLRAVKVVEIEFGPVGCAACTSGDSPLFDFEQHVMHGY